MKLDIGGHSGSVVIEVLGYENEHPLSISDANWLLCFIDLRVGEFTGHYQASLSTHDFMQFYHQLKDVLSAQAGSARFDTDEDGLRLAVEIDERGNFRITGAARSTGAPQTVLSFTIDSDQSYLQQTNTQLARIVQEFPVRTQVNAS